MDKSTIPLALAKLEDEEPIDGRTRLQKMVFVIQQELMDRQGLSENELYEYFAYDYGPFSKELAEDIDRFLDQDLMSERRVEYEDKEKYLYEIEPRGKEAYGEDIEEEVSDELLNLIRDVKDAFNNARLPDVIDYVYENYPEYAENSVY